MLFTLSVCMSATHWRMCSIGACGGFLFRFSFDNRLEFIYFILSGFEYVDG